MADDIDDELFERPRNADQNQADDEAVPDLQANADQQNADNPDGTEPDIDQDEGFIESFGGLAPSLDDAQDSRQGRTLNQEEIDDLLGFQNETNNDEKLTGMDAIVESGMVSYERLPMLEIVFDRLVRMMTTSMRNFTSDNVEISIDSITSVRFGDYLNSIPLPAMIAVFKVEEWDNYGLLTIDASLIYSIVDVLLGGRRGTATMRIEGRPYTTIERNLIERMINILLNDIASAFEPLSSVTVRFDRLETNPRFATIARPANAAIISKIRIDMEDRGGRLDLLLPYATLEPVRELLLQMFMGEKFGRDSIWENHLVTELWNTDVKLRAVLDEVDIPLGEVLEWEVGSFLPLHVRENPLIALKCGDIHLFKGQGGSKNGHMAVQINKLAREE